jgi:hypothetical protein
MLSKTFLRCSREVVVREESGPVTVSGFLGICGFLDAVVAFLVTL